MYLDEPVERPAYSKVIVGDQGDRVNQEPDSGKQIIRRGAASGEADIDVGNPTTPHDLIGNGDYDSGPKNAGGAEALAGLLNSLDDERFSVKIDWLNDEGDTTITSSPGALQNVDTSKEDLSFNLIMRSDRFKVRIVDESGAAQNEIVGTVNAH